MNEHNNTEQHKNPASAIMDKAYALYGLDEAIVDPAEAERKKIVQSMIVASYGLYGEGDDLDYIGNALDVHDSAATKPLTAIDEASSVPDSHPKHAASRSAWIYWLRDIAIALVVTLLVAQFIRPTIVRQESMLDTLHPGDYLLLATQEFTYGGVDRGDIVVFKTDLEDLETHKNKNLIKRVIALPGDTIEITGGNTYVNGVKQNEPYVLGGVTPGDIRETEVPQGMMWVMGDNRVYSKDSRDPSIGFVDMDTIVGKALVRAYPFNQIRMF
ncbi:MAG: signal peptidase I [Clostridiales Family XIII bacterium]|jgi:signal peptidase I|nr:signal peptidase I [Clostridiales Family XIII bacterium]